MLDGVGYDLVRLTSISDNAVATNAQPTCRRDQAIAPVAVRIMVGRTGDEGLRGEVVRNDQIGGPRMMNIHDENHGYCLRTVIYQFEADS